MEEEPGVVRRGGAADFQRSRASKVRRLSMDKANAHLQKWFDTGEMRSVVVRWEEQ